MSEMEFNAKVNELEIEVDNLLLEKENWQKEAKELRQENATLKNTLLEMKKNIVVYQSTLKAVGEQLRSSAGVVDTVTKLLAI